MHLRSLVFVGTVIDRPRHSQGRSWRNRGGRVASVLVVGPVMAAWRHPVMSSKGSRPATFHQFALRGSWCFSSEVKCVRSCSLSIGHQQSYQVASGFFAYCSARVCFASKFLVYEAQVLRFGDYPQGSAGLHMKAYSSASRSTVIVLMGLESLVNTKQERGSFSSRHFTLSSSTPQSYSIVRPALPCGHPPQIGRASHQLHLGLIVHSETPPRV